MSQETIIAGSHRAARIESFKQIEPTTWQCLDFRSFDLRLPAIGFTDMWQGLEVPQHAVDVPARVFLWIEHAEDMSLIVRFSQSPGLLPSMHTAAIAATFAEHSHALEADGYMALIAYDDFCNANPKPRRRR